jgi:hypothetical protein
MIICHQRDAQGQAPHRMFKILTNQQDVGRPKAEVLMTAQRLIAVNARHSERGLKKNGTTFPSGVIVPWTFS